MSADRQQCPDPKLLAALVSGTLQDAKADGVLSHVEDCDDCRARLDVLERNDPLLAAMRVSSPVRTAEIGLIPFLDQAKALVRSAIEGPSTRSLITQDVAEACVGRYQILRELGHGGMGTVYLAEDSQLRRQVALKCPLEQRADDLARFQQEAETLARLDHPNICPIYDVDLKATRPYLALKYIDGETLADRLKREPVDPKLAVRWCLTMAQSLEVAHQQHIVHRDLKPGNIMLESNGKIWLMDFGLSKLLSRATPLTERGHSPGTPGYMAPEQVDPQLGEIGPSTDLFSLGVILYQSLTGQAPFRGSMSEVLAQTVRGEPVAVSTLKPGLDPRLDGICSRAMARRPGDRYASAAEFASALQDVLTSPPVRRRGRVIAMAATMLVALGLGAWAVQPPEAKTKPDARPTDTRPDPSSARERPAAPQPKAQPTAQPAATGSADLPQQSVALLEKYCYACHANDKKHPGLDLRDRVTLLKPIDANEKPYLVPGKPAQSRIWNVIAKHDPEQMPPADQPQPTEAEKDVLKRWIESGAEFPLPSRPKRSFVGEQSLLAIIDKDLQAQPDTKRPYLRYLSLVHLWNSDASDEHLRLVRAAVSKLINSLSGEAAIVPPAIVDPDGTVLRIDLRDYGWKAGKQWLEVARVYPYGLEVAGDAYRRITEEGVDFPYVRADWFVYSASRPPLYHKLVTFPDQVGMPETQSVLERLLAVDPVNNYAKDQLQRAAFTGETSGVSDHNRMVERHRARYGYYWPSYDFFGDVNHQDLFRFPLGPKRLSQTDDNNFEHDGGELIFSLPNGLQAYMLVKSDGTRIDKGPQEIVRDSNQHSGSYDIVNGVSCMGCHRHGMVRFTDSLRQNYVGRTGDTADKVQRLYPAAAEMSRLVESDRKRFLTALDEAIGSFLRVGPQANTAIEDFPEPVTAAARPYDRPLKLADVAREFVYDFFQRNQWCAFNGKPPTFDRYFEKKMGF